MMYSVELLGREMGPDVDLTEERKTGNEQRILRVSLVAGEEGFYSIEIPVLDYIMPTSTESPLTPTA